MDKLRINNKYRIVLWITSALGLFGVNGVFLYAVLLKPESIKEAFGNIYSMVFMAEAFLLLPLFCFLIYINKLKSPNWFGFLLLSLAGSLAFSIPFSILLWSRNDTI
jgi:hypothetical protein